MNFLAHIYLSGNNELLTIGNFVSDGVRGNKYKNYPEAMQAGILLHRQIDTFTDAHSIFRRSTKKLHKPYGHYSGVIVDIFYDHFLAKNWNNYSEIPLDIYIQNFYKSISNHLDILPPRFQHLTPIMIEGNWLLSYATIEGIQQVLNGMNRRTKNRSKMNEATRELQLFYSKFEDDFTEFFDELIEFSTIKRTEISNQFNL